MESLLNTTVGNIAKNNESEGKQDEFGLPRSTLMNFIKDELKLKGMKADSKVLDVIDKLTIKFIMELSAYGSQRCAKSGKKTLNIEHILEALNMMHLDNYIKKLKEEDFLKDCRNDDDINSSPDRVNMNVKQAINQFKIKTGKRKKKYQSPEDLEELEREQNILFEEARKEYINNYKLKAELKEENCVLNGNDKKATGKEQEELEHNVLCDFKNHEDEEVDFD